VLPFRLFGGRRPGRERAREATLSVAALAFGLSSAGGATRSTASCTTSWASLTSGDWNEPANWTAGRVPDASDDVFTVDGT
jgi:hypothetical protein